MGNISTLEALKGPPENKNKLIKLRLPKQNLLFKQNISFLLTYIQNMVTL